MKAYLVLIEKFSNYKNRKLVLPEIDKEEPLTVLQEEGYTFDYCRGATGTSVLVDFNPNDGISTSVIINWENDYEPDYLMVLDVSANLISRWFIMEFKRTRGKQYQVQLQRDVLADYYSSLKNSPLFIQKAILEDDNPLIFNRENMSYNQIKQSELLLKDNTNSAWIVGYVAQNTDLSKTYTASPQSTNYPNITSGIILNNLDDPSEGGYFNRLSGTVNVRTRTKQEGAGLNRIDLRAGFDSDFETVSKLASKSESGQSYAFIYSGYGENLESEYVKALNNYKNNFKYAFDNYNKDLNQQLTNNTDFNTLMSYNGQIVQISNQYYKMTITVSTTTTKTIQLEDSGDTAALSSVMDAVVANMDGVTHSKSGDPYFIWWDSQTYNVSLELASIPGTLTMTLSNDRRHTEDAPYDIFAMPYTEDNLRLAQELVRQDTNSKIYDVQVLPYVPVSNILNEEGVIDISLGEEASDFANIIAPNYTEYAQEAFYNWEISQGSPEKTLCIQDIYLEDSQSLNTFIASYSLDDPEDVVEDIAVRYYSEDNKIRVIFQVSDDISSETIDHISVMVRFGWTKQNAIVSHLIWCTRINRSFAIAANIAPASDKKVANETEFARIVSPNWNGAYEFSVAKNEGVQTWNVDCTFKPYTPYIHVAPQFGGLYGTVQDARGLICNGDFSITMVNSAWSEYEVQNKNYQQIFNSSIQTMDKNNKLSVASGLASSMMGAGAFGVGAGLMTGNPIVGVGAGIASAAGGLADIAISQAQYQNNRQYQIDQFGYQLGNIQARPDTLNKVSTLTANNRIWPFVEFYKATDTEITALKNKIKYNGMTVMAIGTMNDYLNKDYEGMNYFQASVIMNTDIACDNHTLEQIDNELQKGVYL